MQKILITGSNGFLGQKLISKLLLKNEYDIIATSKGNNRLKVKDGYKYIKLNVSSYAEVENVFASEKPDVVINTVAMTNVDKCEDDKELADKLNVVAVKYILDACRKNDTFFIHISTDFIFDGLDGPYRENSVPNPINFYGLTKLKAEKIIEESSVKSTILRTMLLYGINEDTNSSNIILWAKNALEKGHPISVVDDQYRTPTLIDDLADGCLLVAQQRIKGVFNISGKDFLSIYELVKKVGKFWGLDTSNMKRVNSDTLNQKAKRPLKTGFNLSKSMGILGYNPHSIEEGFEIMNKQM